MPTERTLSIIKPDAVAKNVIGEIYSRFEKAGLKIIAAKMLQLSQEQAQGFYAVHKERPFYSDLLDYMTSGPVIVVRLERDKAVDKWREVIGATNPQNAENIFKEVNSPIRKVSLISSKHRNGHMIHFLNYIV